MVRSPSLAEQVADSVVAGIADGTLAFGQRVLETELARALGVSRIPVREALKTLAAQGIVEMTPHRGARVNELDERRVDRVCEARVALERMAARDARGALRDNPEALGRLDEAIRAMERCVREKDWAGVNRADLAFHRAVCLASGNDIVLTLWETLARHVCIILGREILAERERTGVVEHHQALRDLLLRGEEPEVRAGIAGHIMRLRRERGAASAAAPADLD
jgi:DNA-binding GntR family transcriptional regulator